MTRLDDEASFRKLAAYLGGEVPPIPAALPRVDDRVLGVSFFKTRVIDDDFSNLTLPRTFFGRSEIRDVDFRNTDLRESNLCWNDFISVDFSDAVLTNSDLRSSIFEHVSFAISGEPICAGPISSNAPSPTRGSMAHDSCVSSR